MAWQRSVKQGLPWIGAVLLGALAWVDLRYAAETQPFRLGALLVLIIAHGLLVVALERGLAFTSLERAWRYRLAFLASAALPLAQGFTYGLVSLLFPHQATGASPTLGIMALRQFIACLAAFGGGLVATRINEGLWENNSPPPDELQAKVYQRHREVIGEVAPTSRAKRGFDFCLALLGTIISAPVWIAGAFSDLV